jgi:hypothetical protein
MSVMHLCNLMSAGSRARNHGPYVKLSEKGTDLFSITGHFWPIVACRDGTASLLGSSVGAKVVRSFDIGSVGK